MTLRLARESLHAAPTASLVRLAAWLRLDVARKPGEADGPYRHRLVNAIQRAEKRIARMPRERTA